MLLAEIVAASRAVAETASRLEKAARLAELLRRMPPAELRTAVRWLGGELAQGRIGIGGAVLRDALAASEPAAEPSLGIADVDAAFARVAARSGAGSAAVRREALADVFRRATGAERDFLARLLMGELRQGALEGVLVEAIARAASVPAGEVRRAAMMAGELAAVAAAALAEGSAGLARFRLRLLEPVQPMLAQTASGAAEAVDALGEAALDFKLDGARVQVHRDGDEVRVFSRALREVTPVVPELVTAARALPVRSAVLDGEAIALRPDGTPHPFQVTMRRFGRKADEAALRATLPLTGVFFDALHLDGEDLLARPARERFEALAAVLPPAAAIPRLVTDDRAEADRFLAEAIRRGHEGLVAKALGAPYEAGHRGGAWLKVKPAHTLDLVVLAAEWGHGRRRGLLSNLHLGARDPASGGWAMLGKTFKGMTDAMLAWQTERLLGLKVAEDGLVVHVRPELVVEVAFDGVQGSRYESGLALRFARVKRYREDKRATEADTIDAVRAIAARGGEPFPPS